MKLLLLSTVEQQTLRGMRGVLPDTRSRPEKVTLKNIPLL